MSRIKSLTSAGRAVLRQRKHFASDFDWLLRVYDGMLNRIPWLPLPGRGAVWQVQCRGHAHPYLVRQGSKDWAALREVVFDNEYGFVTSRLGVTPRTIVDFGSNIGLSVRHWLDCYPNALIVGVEPDPDSFSQCQRTLAEHVSNRRVRLLRACVASDRGTRILSQAGDPLSRRIATSGDGVPVYALTPTDIFDELGHGQAVDLLKCDIEGAEAQIFARAKDWVERVRAIAIEIHPPYTSKAFLNDLVAARWNFILRHHSVKKGGLENLLVVANCSD